MYASSVSAGGAPFPSLLQNVVPQQQIKHSFILPQYTEFPCITYNLEMRFAFPNFPLKSKQQDAMHCITSQSLLIKSSFCPTKKSFYCYTLPAIFTKLTVIKLSVLGHISGHNFRCFLLANINISLHNTTLHLLKCI